MIKNKQGQNVAAREGPRRRDYYVLGIQWVTITFDAEEEKLLLITNTDRDTSKYSKWHRRAMEAKRLRF